MAPHPLNHNSALQAKETIRNYKDQGRLYKRLFGEVGIRVPLFEETKSFSFKKNKSGHCGKEAKECQYIQKSILSSIFTPPKLDYMTCRSNGVNNFHNGKSDSDTTILCRPSLLSPEAYNAEKSSPITNGGGLRSVLNGMKRHNLQPVMKEKRKASKPRYRFDSDKNHDFSDSDDDEDATTVVTAKITSAKSIASIRSFAVNGGTTIPIMPLARMVNDPSSTSRSFVDATTFTVEDQGRKLSAVVNGAIGMIPSMPSIKLKVYRDDYNGWSCVTGGRIHKTDINYSYELLKVLEIASH